MFSIDLSWQMILLTALSLSIGWGIRGNFGHETGAAIPGVLAAIALVLTSDRADWLTRIQYVAMFGALGWSFGGSMSYMHVVSYTHSGHSPTVLYGFANLFAIGFLWAAIGAAGTAIPLFLKSEDLSSIFVPLAAVFLAWSIRTFFLTSFFYTQPSKRHQNPLYWYDTDWLAAFTALIATLIVIAIRRRIDAGTSLILHLSIGWFLGFLILVNLFKLRMTPPRGDNWSGCVGMVAGLLVYCWQNSLAGVALVTLVTGFLGGIGFALGQMVKILWIRTGLKTNWHSVMEQTQGLFHGIGLAIGIGFVVKRSPDIGLQPPLPAWMSIFSIIFVLVFLTYMNHRKATATWVEKVKSLPEKLYKIPVSGYACPGNYIGWFEIIYIGLGIVFISILLRHRISPVEFIPASWMGKGQLLYLIFMWWCVIFNFERALVGFTPQRMVTEGTITFNAIICTFLVTFIRLVPSRPIASEFSYIDIIIWTPIFGVVMATFVTILLWRITHGIYGKAHIPGAGLHIRFGPDSNATSAKPQAEDKHP